MGKTNEARRYLHMTVSDALRARIVNRELPPGSLLPSENDLTTEFGVSRSVVRQALRTLAEEGHVQAAPGRGTVVTSHREWHRDAQRTAGLSAQMRALGARVSTQVLEYGPRPPRGRAAERFDAQHDVLFLERLRLLDDEPVAFIRTWLPLRIAESVPRAALEDASLHNELHDRAGISITGGRRQIRAVSAAGDLARRLAVAEGSAILLLEGESLDQQGETIEVFSTWHRSDRISLDITEMHTGPQQPTATRPEDDRLRQAEEVLAESLRQIRGLRARA